MPDKQPNAPQIRITVGQVSIDEAGRVIINNPDLARAIKEAQSGPGFAASARGINVVCPDWPDWKCK
jgi:hypothetical protein